MPRLEMPFLSFVLSIKPTPPSRQSPCLPSLSPRGPVLIPAFVHGICTRVVYRRLKPCTSDVDDLFRLPVKYFGADTTVCFRYGHGGHADSPRRARTHPRPCAPHPQPVSWPQALLLFSGNAARGRSATAFPLGDHSGLRGFPCRGLYVTYRGLRGQIPALSTPSSPMSFPVSHGAYRAFPGSRGQCHSDQTPP